MTLTAGWEAAQLQMTLVFTNEQEAWKQNALDTIQRLTAFVASCGGAEFTADDIRDALDACGIGRPHHANAYSAIIRVARSRGWLVPTGRYVPSRRTERHASMIPVYRPGL